MNSNRPYRLASPKTASGSSSPNRPSHQMASATVVAQTDGQTRRQIASAVHEEIFNRKALRTQVLQQDLSYIGFIFVVTRLALITVGLIAQSIFPPDPIGKATALSPYAWLDMWGVWDSYWYMDIVENGYSTLGRLADYPDQTNLVFFPLYPSLVKLTSFVTGDLFMAGLLVSNLCLLASCYVLYLLVKLERGRKVARRTVKYLLLFPISFILSGLFTESLYLCLTLLCFYLARRRQWGWAGLCGAGLSATRSLGVLIMLPLAFEYMRSIRFRPRAIRWNSLFVLFVPLGLAAFSFYNYRLTGDFLFFKTNQAAWEREIMNPVLSLWQAASQTVGEQSVKKLVELCFCLAGLGVLLRFYREIGFSYWLFGMYSILIPLSAGIASMPRFTLPIFPLYIALALMASRKWCDRSITVAFCTLQGALMMLWCTGQGLII